jgi:hypothetical protein
MEYWHLRLLNNWWTAPFLKTHYSIIPLFQYSNPVKWVGATLVAQKGGRWKKVMSNAKAQSSNEIQSSNDKID